MSFNQEAFKNSFGATTQSAVTVPAVAQPVVTDAKKDSGFKSLMSTVWNFTTGSVPATRRYVDSRIEEELDPVLNLTLAAFVQVQEIQDMLGVGVDQDALEAKVEALKQAIKQTQPPKQVVDVTPPTQLTPLQLPVDPNYVPAPPVKEDVAPPAPAAVPNKHVGKDSPGGRKMRVNFDKVSN